MQEMLHRLVKQGFSSDTIRRLLAAFPDKNRNLRIRKGTIHPGHISSPTLSPLVEPLTPRELEVLHLLRGPSSIKEIALKLNIAYSTAKRHTINIYAKLGANQRLEAVAIAEELNILLPR